MNLQSYSFFILSTNSFISYLNTRTLNFHLLYFILQCTILKSQY
nr:MAG TPA: hypothetical protein [Caudoviricetes sp.]